MKTTGTAVKLGILWLVLLVFTVTIVIVFGQMRFNRTTGYSALFTGVSGLRAGQFVRAAGVEVGKVSKVTLIDGDTTGIGGLRRGQLAAAGSGDDRVDPLPEPDRRPLPRAQTRRQRSTAGPGRHDPA